MSKATGHNDVVFGSVVSGRLQGTVGAETTLGLFINTLPVRIRVNDLNATQLVKQTHQSLLDLLLYEHASLAMAQRCANRSTGTPLFNALLNCRHSQADSAFEVITGQERTNYPCYLAIDDYGEEFVLDLQLDSSVDAYQVIGYMQAALAGLLEALEVQSAQPASQIFVMSDTEQHYWTGGTRREPLLLLPFNARTLIWRRVREPKACYATFGKTSWPSTRLGLKTTSSSWVVTHYWRCVWLRRCRVSQAFHYRSSSYSVTRLLLSLPLFCLRADVM